MRWVKYPVDERRCEVLSYGTIWQCAPFLWLFLQRNEAIHADCSQESLSYLATCTEQERVKQPLMQRNPVSITTSRRSTYAQLNSQSCGYCRILLTQRAQPMLPYLFHLEVQATVLKSELQVEMHTALEVQQW